MDAQNSMLTLHEGSFIRLNDNGVDPCMNAKFATHVLMLNT